MKQEGFTLISLLITTFIIGTVTVAVFGLFLLSLRTVQGNERRVVAVALANERVEMVRNLPYVEVGTVGGVPAGSIPQTETVTRNSLPYTVRTDIRYVDDPFDGAVAGTTGDDDKVTICHKPGAPVEQTLEVAQSSLNAHLAHGDMTGACGSGGEGSGSGDAYNADYKQVRVEVSWSSPNAIRPILLITHVVPQGLEGGEAGGTLDFLVLDAEGVGVPGATVTLANDTVSPAVDITTETNSEGRLVLPGLPGSANTYELTVTKDGFTQEQTYDTTATFFPDVDHAHLTMIPQELTSKTFSIDLTSEVTLETNDEQGKKVKNVAYVWRGSKTIGVDNDNNLVYLTDITGNTGANGRATHSDLVWDAYSLTIDGVATGYDIKETSEVLPLSLNPGEDVTLTVTLTPHTPISLQVTVTDPAGIPTNNATVQATGTGFDETQVTGAVGQVYFGDLPSNDDYTVNITAPGFQDFSEVVPVSGTSQARFTLAPSG